MPLSPGARPGPYEILSPLGEGGMGEVYRARDPRLGREIAIKVLPAELSSERERLARFEQEARSASALNHPNIVTIYEIGQADSAPYIAIELVEGKTLRELLVSGPLPLRKTLGIAAQVAGGLSRAHEAGIVHRDLKPENLMVSKDELVSTRRAILRGAAAAFLSSSLFGGKARPGGGAAPDRSPKLFYVKLAFQSVKLVCHRPTG